MPTVNYKERPVDPEVARFHQLIENGTLDELRSQPNAKSLLDQPGRFGATSLMVAISAKDIEKVSWLVDQGADPEITDDFSTTALGCAVSHDFVPAIQLLVDLGVDRGYSPKYPQKPRAFSFPVEDIPMPEELEEVMSEQEWREMMRSGNESLEESEMMFSPSPYIQDVYSVEALNVFVAAGDRLGDASRDLKTELLGLLEEQDFTGAKADFIRGHKVRFGSANPERMREPFWGDMIRKWCNAYTARSHYLGKNTFSVNGPVWCNDRFGASLNKLQDGRYIQVGGEHEDFYDPDFCIYNDVIVFDGNGGFEIYGYPKSEFPPTDFHTATLIGDSIYIIGSLGYPGERRYGTTPVYRLDVKTLSIDSVSTSGNPPGWIHGHLASADSASSTITISRGTIETGDSSRIENDKTFVLDLNSMNWAVK